MHFHLLDVSDLHLDAAVPTLGPAWQSNCRALVPGDRQFSDEQITAIGDRGG